MICKQYSGKDLIKTANDDDLTINAVISTSDIDRDNEVVRQAGIKTDKFMDNPIVLRQHDRDSLPIGKVLDIKSDDNQSVATIQFSKANPEGAKIYQMYKEGTLTSWSIGFKPLDAINRDGYKELTDIELLEISSVNIPANAGARAKADCSSDCSQCLACKTQIDIPFCSDNCSKNYESAVRSAVKGIINENTR